MVFVLYLNEVSITVKKGAAKAKAAYIAVQGEISSVFHERYIAHNEINSFSGEGRVAGFNREFKTERYEDMYHEFLNMKNHRELLICLPLLKK